MMEDAMEIISAFTDFFQYEFLFIALIATILLSILMGALSPLVVVKKYSFIGSAISHSTLLALAISSLLNLTDNQYLYFAATTILTLIFALVLASSSYKKQIPTDSLIGIFFTTTMSAGVLLQALTQEKSTNLFNYLFGNILLIETSDIFILIILSIFILGHIYINFKKWISFCWNNELALLNGVPSKKYHYLLFTIITLTIVIGLKLAGIILVSSFLIIPGAFSLRISNNLNSVFKYSILFALVSSVLALVISNYFNTTVGPTIAVIQASIFAFTYLPKFR